MRKEHAKNYYLQKREGKRTEGGGGSAKTTLLSMTLLNRNCRYWRKRLVIGDKNTGQTIFGTKYEDGNRADF